MDLFGWRFVLHVSILFGSIQMHIQLKSRFKGFDCLSLVTGLIVVNRDFKPGEVLAIKSPSAVRISTSNWIDNLGCWHDISRIAIITTNVERIEEDTLTVVNDRASVIISTDVIRAIKYCGWVVSYNIWVVISILILRVE